jgi:hypothetical protein
MTAPTASDAPAAYPGRTATVVGDGTTARSRSTGRWRRWRGPITVLAVIALVGLLAALPAPRVSNLPLAPNSTAPNGARAAAQILEREGVDVTFVRRLADVRAEDGAGTTVLLAGEEDLDFTRLDVLADLQADLVLVDAEYAASELAGIAYATDDNPDAVELEPRCDDQDAVAAGSVVASGRVLATTPGAVTCFRDADDDAATGFYAVTTTGDGGRVAVLASSGPLTNQHLSEGGNAALVLRALGRNAHLVWYLPSVYDTGGEEGGPPIGALVPPWVGVLGLQLLLVATVAALWRGRRMGRLVTEPMPVVVRATEATRGRGRLYRRSRAHGHAAAALRAGAARRCAKRLGLATSTPAQQLIDAVALATGRSTHDVAHLFYGPPPTDDSALATLARNLDDIESEVHRS